MKIANIIKTERQILGITQRELAEKLGITQDSISLWETGKRVPDTQYLVPLCTTLDISIDYLLGRTDELGVVLNPGEGFHATPMEQQLILSFRKLPAQSQEYVYGIVQNLALHS